MRILALSDWRVQAIEDIYSIISKHQYIDLFVYAGDDLMRFLDEGTNHFAEIVEATAIESVLFVAGNDDPPLIISSVAESDDVHNLHQAPFEHEGFVFFGQEGSLGPGITTYSEEKIRAHLHAQFECVSDYQPIVVSHVPPYGILDIGQRFGQQHIGSRAVREFIENVKSPLTICGHCHQFGGRSKEHASGTVINIASHDDKGAVGRYAIIDVMEDGIDCTLGSTVDLGQNKLTDLIQVGRRRAKHFHELGITSLEEITEEHREQLTSLPGVGPWHIDRWIVQAEALQAEKITIFGESFSELYSKPLVLFDIETDLKQEQIWLIGVYNYAAGEFVQFFEPDAQRKLLTDFLEYLGNHGTPTLVYYGGNRFDEQCLTQRIEEYGLTSATENYDTFYDLGIKAQQSLFGPFTSYRLKDVATSLGYEYTHANIDGFIVGSQYTKYLLDGIEPEWKPLQEHNRDDVLALKTVTDFIRGEATSNEKGTDKDSL